MGRIGYMGCLVVLGVVMLGVSCLAVFGASGAITAERGDRVAPVAAPPAPKNGGPGPGARPAPRTTATRPAGPAARPRAPGRTARFSPPVELKPRAAAGQQGELTEGNLTSEIPRPAAGLVLTYDLPAGGQPLRIPLPPE